MLFDIIKDRSFSQMMENHLKEMVTYLLQSGETFSILCKIDLVSFSPELPKQIQKELRSMTLFFLAGYTLESTRLDHDKLIFEAGFGTENFGSIVTVPLLSIVQILLEETPAFVNLALPKEILSSPVESDEIGIQNSMNSFLSNPENQKFMKKNKSE